MGILGHVVCLRTLLQGVLCAVCGCGVLVICGCTCVLSLVIWPVGSAHGVLAVTAELADMWHLHMSVTCCQLAHCAL